MQLKKKCEILQTCTKAIVGHILKKKYLCQNLYLIVYLFEFDFSSSNTTNFVIKVTRRKNVTLVPGKT